MTITEELFKPGDRVRVKDHAGGTVWTVADIDTNRDLGRCVDIEPAYKLTRPDKANSIRRRYARQSDLEPAP